MSPSTWLSARKSTIISILAGSVSWVLVMGLGWKLWPAGPELVSSADRLAYVGQLLVAVAAVVLLMVIACFRLFDTVEAENPLANAESPAWKLHQRVLQNTVEQSLIFIPALVGLSVRIDPAHTGFLSLLTAIWCAGRVLFWLGYRIKPVLRGPGFDWTLYSSVVALLWFGATLW